MSTTVNSFAVYAYSNHNSHLKYFVVNQPKKNVKTGKCDGYMHNYAVLTFSITSIINLCFLLIIIHRGIMNKRIGR